MRVPPVVAAFPPATGTGKMWQHVLSGLSKTADVRVGTPSRRRFIGRADVWLHDGHQGPLPVRAPVVAQLHEAAWDDPASRAWADPAFIEAYERPSRAGAEQADRIVTPSESSRRQIVEVYGIAAERVAAVPHGVDAAVFHPGAAGGAEAVAEATGDPGRPYVLFVSQLHPRKNYAALRDAMTHLAERGYPHSLVLVGWPPLDRADAAEIERDACADLPGTTGRVVCLRDLTEAELAGVMAGATAFCLPSFMEGFGLPALEAMACGTPVVVSDRGALPEVVGDAGIVTPPTAEAVEAALERLLVDDGEASRRGAAGLERSRRFTWDATARGWMKTLEDAVG